MTAKLTVQPVRMILKDFDIIHMLNIFYYFSRS